ncbi:MAG: hypothetical protein ABIZ80_05905 [Bryobacteraceae bacterium]
MSGPVIEQNGERMKRMTRMTLKLTPEELKLLVSLASDQLFRKEFIDPRMPGYRPNSEELSLGKSLIGRLRLMLVEQNAAKGTSAAKPTG